MLRISPLKNPIREYAWGSTTALQSLLGLAGSQGKPMAELWMGAHPKAPSQIRVSGEWKPLNEAIETFPEEILGTRVTEVFSGKLPFLFKVIAAARPLSIQVHPTLEQAEKGYAEENHNGIPIDSPKRNYKDANHKPEILCAISPFQGLAGFREIKEILDLFHEVLSTSLFGELDLFRRHPEPAGLKHFFISLFSMDQRRRRRLLTEAAKAASKRVQKDSVFYWMDKLHRAYPGDVGMLAPILLNLVELNPGEALYISPGELHAYLGGTGIELMASSDNVLRGGLTSKHVDLHELLKVVRFKERSVEKVETLRKVDCESLYRVPCREFLLSSISLNQGKGYTSAEHCGVEILICTDGKAEMEDTKNGEVFPLTSGRSVLVPAHVPGYRIKGHATLYMASVPRHVRTENG